MINIYNVKVIVFLISSKNYFAVFHWTYGYNALSSDATAAILIPRQNNSMTQRCSIKLHLLIQELHLSWLETPN